MSNWISRVATDVGGTFTDLVRLDIDPESGQSRVTTAKTATTPPDFERGVLDVLRKGGVPLREIDLNRFSRAWHDRCHQRCHRAQGCEGRTDHHRGLPGHA